MSDDSNPPVIPQEYLYGVKVVDIGDIRVSRGKTRRPVSTCKHLRQVYDKEERTIYCSDCEQTLDPFTAYEALIVYYNAAFESLQKRERQILEAEKFSIRSRAAKALDEVWRGRKLVPTCVSCGEGLLPEDYVRITSKCSKEIALAKRKKKK